MSYLYTEMIRCGEATCATPEKAMCRYCWMKPDGSAKCLMFDQQLQNSQADYCGWTLRCDDCLKQEKYSSEGMMYYVDSLKLSERADMIALLYDSYEAACILLGDEKQHKRRYPMAGA